MIHKEKFYKTIVLIGITIMSFLSQFVIAQNVIISSANIKAVRIIASRAEIKPIADYLRNYLELRTNKVDRHIYNRIQKETKICQFILATEEDIKDLSGVDINANFISNAHQDSYILDAQQIGNSSVIYLIGKTSSGVRSAINRFICKMINDGEKLYLKQGREERSPFINIRLAMIAPSARRQIKIGSILDDANYELWNEDRLRAYPELFAQFGFSGIQISEIQGYGHIAGDYLKKAQKAVKTLALGAKDLSMFVSLDQWGDCPFVEGQTYCWEDPEERKVLINFFTEISQRYGSLTDHIYIHVGDPGGATHKGCTKFKTPQLLTSGILDIFKKKNPKILATMSTWANTEFWKHNPVPINLNNYAEPFKTTSISFGQPIPDSAKFLDDTWMPKEVGIALHRTFNQQQADIIETAGRPVDVWGWYIGDMEMHNNITLNTENIDKYYKNLPLKASKQIRIQTIELCFHGWPQIINTYAGAQKMWDPYKNIEEIEREFCTAAFGPANSEAVLALYQACANPWDYDVWRHADEHLPRPSDLGTQPGNVRLRKVLDAAESIQFPENWKPNFAFPVSVNRYLDMLKARVKLLLAYSQAMMEINQAREQGNDKLIAEIKRNAIANLPYLPIDPLYQPESTSKPHYKLQSWADYIDKL